MPDRLWLHGMPKSTRHNLRPQEVHSHKREIVQQITKVLVESKQYNMEAYTKQRNSREKETISSTEQARKGYVWFHVYRTNVYIEEIIGLQT